MRAARLVSTVHHLEQRGELRRVLSPASGLPLYRPARLEANEASLRGLVPPGLPNTRLRQPDRRSPASIAGRLQTGVASRPMTTAVVLVLLAATVSMTLSGWELPIDLEVYRRGGQSVLDGATLYEQPYGMLPFTYPPLAAIAFTVLAWLPALVATTVMAVGSYAALFALVSLTVSYLKAPPWWVPAGFLAAVLAEPVTATVSLGQINLILTLLVLFDLLHPTRRWSGVLLGIAICIKLTPAIFVFAVLAQRDLPMLRRTLATIAAGSLLPLLFVPGAWAQFWFHALWDPQRVGGLAYTGNQSLTGALWRAFGPGGSPSLTNLLTTAVLGLLEG